MTTKDSKEKLPQKVLDHCAIIAIQYMTPDRPNGDEFTTQLKDALEANDRDSAKEATALMCASMMALGHPMGAICAIHWEEAFKEHKPRIYTP